MHSDEIDFDEYGIRWSQFSPANNNSYSSIDLDIRPANNTGGWSLITGTMVGTTDSSGIEVRMLNSSSSIINVEYRTTNSATTGSNASTNSLGCPMNYYNIGNSSGNSAFSGERSNFMINFIHAGSSSPDFLYGVTHYLSTSGTTHSNRYIAKATSNTDIHFLRFQRWNGADFKSQIKVHRLGAAF